MARKIPSLLEVALLYNRLTLLALLTMLTLLTLLSPLMASWVGVKCRARVGDTP